MAKRYASQESLTALNRRSVRIMRNSECRQMPTALVEVVPRLANLKTHRYGCGSTRTSTPDAAFLR
jgi:hypothetical protein